MIERLEQWEEIERAEDAANASAGGKASGAETASSPSAAPTTPSGATESSTTASTTMSEPSQGHLLPGPEKGPCPDGCGRFGRLLRNGHVRGCPCRSCLGKRNRTKGLSKQRAARKKLEIAGPSLGADHEENWLGPVRAEVKSGAQVRPAATAYYRMEAQSEEARPIGDLRPFVGIAMPEGTTDGIVLIRLSRLREVVAALAVSLDAG